MKIFLTAVKIKNLIIAAVTLVGLGFVLLLLKSKQKIRDLLFRFKGWLTELIKEREKISFLMDEVNRTITNGELEIAKVKLERICQLDSNNKRGRKEQEALNDFLQARECVAKGQYQEAEDYAFKAKSKSKFDYKQLELNKITIPINMHKASKAIDSEQWREAEEHLKKVLSQNSDYKAAVKKLNQLKKAEKYLYIRKRMLC